eukprot:35917_1
MQFKVGDSVDVQVNVNPGDWKMGIITDIKETQIKVQFYGADSKRDRWCDKDQLTLFNTHTVKTDILQPLSFQVKALPVLYHCNQNKEYLLLASDDEFIYKYDIKLDKYKKMANYSAYYDTSYYNWHFKLFQIYIQKELLYIIDSTPNIKMIRFDLNKKQFTTLNNNFPFKMTGVLSNDTERKRNKIAFIENTMHLFTTTSHYKYNEIAQKFTKVVNYNEDMTDLQRKTPRKDFFLERSLIEKHEQILICPLTTKKTTSTSASLTLCRYDIMKNDWSFTDYPIYYGKEKWEIRWISFFCKVDGVYIVITDWYSYFFDILSKKWYSKTMLLPTYLSRMVVENNYLHFFHMSTLADHKPFVLYHLKIHFLDLMCEELILNRRKADTKFVQRWINQSIVNHEWSMIFPEHLQHITASYLSIFCQLQYFVK